ncbi:hypothetical protein J4399_00140 [Candidatus Woesearchaeota archaeon]|nr:hypothetical protein [Candidatus Woesearchaeota archaeon]HIJ13273.1 hypothetical protein [Candidatus Woesearchaeota archaeon]
MEYTQSKYETNLNKYNKTVQEQILYSGTNTKVHSGKLEKKIIVEFACVFD